VWVCACCGGQIGGCEPWCAPRLLQAVAMAATNIFAGPYAAGIYAGNMYNAYPNAYQGAYANTYAPHYAASYAPAPVAYQGQIQPIYPATYPQASGHLITYPRAFPPYGWH
jgi:hypothetical protein